MSSGEQSGYIPAEQQKPNAVEPAPTEALKPEAALRDSDPRQYIAVVNKWKAAQELDTQQLLPWQLQHNDAASAICQSPEMAVVGFTFRDPNSSKDTNLALLVKDGQTNLHLTTALPSSDMASSIISLLNEAQYSMEPQQYLAVATSLLHNIDKVKQLTEDQLSWQGKLLLLHNYPTITPDVDLTAAIEWPAKLANLNPTLKDQYVQLANQVASKLLPDQQAGLLQRIKLDLFFDPNIFTQDTVSSSAFDSLVNEIKRHAHPTSYIPLPEAERFPAEQLVKVENRINSSSELAQRLANIPAQRPTYTHAHNSFSNESAQMVDLSQVVGGDYQNTFLLDAEDRGIEYLFTMASQIQDGQFDISANTAQRPIRVVEHRGNYFVDSDGSHRVAVLKALKIPYAPMMVMHASEPITLPPD